LAAYCAATGVTAVVLTGASLATGDYRVMVAGGAVVDVGGRC
jgi:hypothetical protein